MSEITKVTCKQCQGSGNCQECEKGTHCIICGDTRKCSFCDGGQKWELRVKPVRISNLEVSGSVTNRVGVLTITNTDKLDESGDYKSADILTLYLDEVIIALLSIRKELSEDWEEAFNSVMI